MRRATLTGLVAAILAVALAWWLWPARLAPDAARRPAATPEPRRASLLDEPRAAPHGAPSTSRDDIIAVEPETPRPVDFRARLHAAGDYLEFAQQTLPAARAGDAAAQFYLSKALAYCESLYEWYFIERSPDGRRRHRTLDEAQQITAVRPYFTADDVRDIQARCQRLRSQDDGTFGASNEWFDAALAQDFPLAQAHSAYMLAIQSTQSGDAAKTRMARDQARRLAFESLREGEVAAMLQVAEVGAYLAGEGYSQSSVQRWGWLLAATLRAAPSVEVQEWVQMACRIDTQCQPYETPADVIRRKAGNHLDEVERRAREINEKLDAGTLTESDLGG